MYFLITLFASLFTLGSTSPFQSTPNLYAVLIAGSNGFENYRHQADVCHAYHILRNNGVPAENIITFMYDDIANNHMNPYPGEIFNAPNGSDVYTGVVIDYSGDEVTPENFLKALKGDKELAAKGKKVLTSGSEDHVFIYYSDHGAVGLVGFPDNMLTSKDLNDALVYMHDNKMFSEMTFYLEACESGSMFEGILSEEINIYATTASSSDESSYGAYCSTDGKLFGTCLGDEYSVAWMQDSESHNLTKETLEQQFQNVRKTTQSSSPHEYGSKSLADKETVSQFQGVRASTDNPINKPITDLVNSRDIPLVTLRRRIMASKGVAETHELQKQLSQVVAGRKFFDSNIKKVVSDLCERGFCSDVDSVFSSRTPLVDHETYHNVAHKVHFSCINLGTHSYALKYMYVFANLVEENQFYADRLQKFMEALEESCETYLVNHGFKAIV